MRRLFLITNSFPYGKGEEFLEAEILVLKRYFNVTVVPIQTGDNKKRDYNIKADLRLSQLVGANKRKLIISWIFGFIFCNFKLLFCEIKKSKFSLKSFAARTLRVYYAKKYFKLLNEDLKADDILYFFWLEYPILAARMANITIPMISRAHGYDVYKERWGGYIPIQESLINSVQHVYTVSSNACQYLKQLYPQINKKITFSPLGINKLYHNSQKINSNNYFSFLSCSNVVAVKRVHLIIELLSYLYQDNIDFHWTHIGGGELFENTKELANRKINGKFTFTGILSNSDVQRVLSESQFDLFITTTESEGRPVSIMEAQAYAIPVLATNVGGIPEMVNNDNGWLIDKDFDVKDVVNTLRNIILNKNLLSEKSNKAYDNYTAKFNAELNYTLFCNEINML